MTPTTYDYLLGPGVELFIDGVSHGFVEKLTTSLKPNGGISALNVVRPKTECLPADFKSPMPKVCPECYGTGYHKGYGGPCSKGCKP